MSIKSVIPSNHLILCHPLLLLPSIFPSIKGFSIESILRIRWPKYWSFSFSSSPSNEYPRLVFFRIDWFDLAIPGTLKSLLQHHSPVLWCSVQLSHPCMTPGKTIALTIQTFTGKVMSLLFNTLFRFVIAFLPRSNHRAAFKSQFCHLPREQDFLMPGSLGALTCEIGMITHSQSCVRI